MNKNIIIICIALVAAVSISAFSPKNNVVGTISNQRVTFPGATNTSSTVTATATTTPIVTANPSRTWLFVSYNGNSNVTLYLAGNTTTTGVTSLGGGIILSSTTQRSIDLSSFTGYLMGIADTTSTIEISHN